MPFVAVIPLTVIGYLIVHNTSLNNQQRAMDSLSSAMWGGLDADLAYLDAQGDEVATLPTLHDHILAQDYEATLATLLTERQTRNIGLMGLANPEGYIITRTRSVATLGEHAFSASPQGRAIASGSLSVQSIEVSSFDRHQVLMTTGRWVIDEQEKLGALFANYLLDDSYTLALADEHLEPLVPDAGLAFYTKEFGIYGSSFDAATVRQSISDYFTPERLANAEGLHTLHLNGQLYRVKNFPIAGLEGSETGALVFLPITSGCKQTFLIFIGSLILALGTDLIIKKRL